MIENISFCSCCRLDKDEAKETQCMFFGFSDRAKKALSEEFLYQITEGNPEENRRKTGISLSDDDQSDGHQVFITKLEENYYRIPTVYVDSFIRCLFKYIPAFYIPQNDIKKDYYCSM